MAPRRSAALMTEQDGPDDDQDGGSPQGNGSMPEGLVNNDRGTGGQNQRQGDDAEFFIIEDDQRQQGQGQSQDDGSGEGEGAAAVRQDGNQQHQEDRLQDDGQGGTRAERESRAARRQRQREGRDRTLQRNAELEAEVAALRDKVGGIEPRLTEFDQDRVRRAVADVEREITESTQQAAQARRKLAEAIANGDGDSINTALDERDQAIMKGQQLLARKNILTTGNVAGIRQQPPRQQPDPAAQQRQQQQQQQQQPAPLPTRVQAQIRQFQDDHPWWNPDDQADTDSQIVTAIDNAVIADGFDPNTKDYWDELRDRVRERLPHKFRGGARQQLPNGGGRQVQQQAPARRGPQVGGPSDRGGNNNGGRQGVRLTPERKQALVDIGVLSADGTAADKQRLNKYLRQYAEFDRVNGAAR